MPGVTVAQLRVKDFKRIRAVELEPQDSGLTIIGGRNRQGKTSVLDAIAYALGGDRMKPSNPHNEDTGKKADISVTLSNGLKVTRKGKTGSLSVTDPKGKKAGQALLSETVSVLALDLPKFMNASVKEKADYLLSIIGLTEELETADGAINALFDDRKDANKELKRLEGLVDSLPYHEDAPADEVSFMDKANELEYANSHNAELAEIAEQFQTVSDEITNMEEVIEEMKKRQAKLATQVNESEPIDTEALQTEMATIEETNAQVRENATQIDAVVQRNRAADKATELTDLLSDARKDRLSLLEGADLPLPGLGIAEGELVYEDQPWDNMSGAEQLRVATAIVQRMNPDCAFVLVDELESMDIATLEEFAAWAGENNLQVIGTRVSVGEECTIQIVDGEIDGEEDF